MSNVMPLKSLMNKIIYLRGQKVMLDSDLAELYGVETKVLNQAVTRNPERFPQDFMYQLTNKEFTILKSQFATSSLRSNFGTLNISQFVI
ncbi:MAG: ORF6N domain-containing protein [Candidatus Cloacimonadota bacterium]|nr:ORF6N domain-containing protein [Candidatus Cloacimonadota bacterium]